MGWDIVDLQPASNQLREVWKRGQLCAVLQDECLEGSEAADGIWQRRKPTCAGHSQVQPHNVAAFIAGDPAPLGDVSDLLCEPQLFGCLGEAVARVENSP